MENEFVQELRNIKESVIDFTERYVRYGGDVEKLEYVPSIIKLIEKQTYKLNFKPIKLERRGYTLLEISEMEEKFYANENN